MLSKIYRVTVSLSLDNMTKAQPKKKTNPLEIVSQMGYNRYTMAKRTAMIRARTKPKLKKDAERILRKLGLSPSDAINLFYEKIVVRKGIPFELVLEDDEDPEDYILVRDTEHLKELIGYKDE